MNRAKKMCGYCNKHESVGISALDEQPICQECIDADDYYWDMMSITSAWNER